MIFKETVDIFHFRNPTQFTSNCTVHTLQRPSIPGLRTGMLQPHKYLRWLLTSRKPLLYICSFSAFNLVRGRRFIWCKGRGCILWFPKTVSPSPRGVGGRQFYSITVFFCDGCKSVIKRPWKQSNIAKGLLAGTDFRHKVKENDYLYGKLKNLLTQHTWFSKYLDISHQNMHPALCYIFPTINNG